MSKEREPLADAPAARPARRRTSAAAAGAAAVHYRVAAPAPAQHLFEVELRIARPAADQVVSLPVWIPGSYMVREFAKHLQELRAEQGGKPLPLEQLDKCSWRVASAAGTPLVLRYRVHAFDTSVRTAWLGTERGFFNGTSLCLRVHGQEQAAHAIEIAAPQADWKLATGLSALKVDRRGFGTYQAPDYEHLVDCPVEMGPLWQARFDVLGVPHEFVVAGAAASFDGDRLLADTRRICEAQIRFWHGRKKPPFERYVFMLAAVDDGYGGLEHRNSTALIASRRDLPRLQERAGDSARPSEGYVTLLGLISHEYFHTWNVKRLRPRELATIDWTRENATPLLWFFEGFTSYYDDLFLRRAGLIDDAQYLKLLTKTVNQVLQAPGRTVQSVAQASFDAWTRYYRPDENTPNATISYYTKGALVALCLDLTLRAEGRGHLDAVMRALWARAGADAARRGALGEDDIAAGLAQVGGRAYSRELADWVHGTGELPLERLLAAHGVQVHQEPAQWAQRLGLRVQESGGTVTVKHVLRGGAAEAAGFAPGDEWLGLEVGGQGWRMSRLDDLPLYAGRQRQVSALVARDRRLARLALSLPGPVQTWRLGVRDADRLQAWLLGAG